MARSGEATRTGGRGSQHGAGRPSTVIRYAPLLEQWLQEEPDLKGAEILRRARQCGYLGGKSALYELVRRLRTQKAARQAANGEAS